jgi:hypothetical protein
MNRLEEGIRWLPRGDVSALARAAGRICACQFVSQQDSVRLVLFFRCIMMLFQLHGVSSFKLD